MLLITRQLSFPQRNSNSDEDALAAQYFFKQVNEVTMEQKEIIEGNKMVAAFMGAIFTKVDNYGTGKFTDEVFYKEHPSQLIVGTQRRFSDFRDLKYHTSWDWLMPVVKKIYDLELPHPSEGEILLSNILAALTKLEINRIWECVIEFINWYNSLTSKNEVK